MATSLAAVDPPFAAGGSEGAFGAAAFAGGSTEAIDPSTSSSSSSMLCRLREFLALSPTASGAAASSCFTGGSSALGGSLGTLDPAGPDGGCRWTAGLPASIDWFLDLRGFLVGFLGTGDPPIVADGSVKAADFGGAFVFARPPCVPDGAAPLERGPLAPFGVGAVFARSPALPDDAAS